MRAPSSSSPPSFSFSDPDFNNSMQDEDYRSQLDVFEDETTDGSGGGESGSLPSLGFLTKQHPIHTVLENRSWEDNATHSSASKTDDDEFRAELERLNLSEQEVSQEIVRAMEAFQKARLSQSASVDDSMIPRTDAASLETDARESTYSSCPSDEAHASIIYEVREPPEVVESRTMQRSCHVEQHLESDSTTTTTSSGMQHVHDDPSADLLTLDENGSLRLDATNTTPYTTIEEQEESSRGQSDVVAASKASDEITRWDATSQSDIERGNGDIFEEESFWEDGLWKTPVIDNTKPHDNSEWSESASTEEQEKRSVSSRPNVRDLAQLYLPNLTPPPPDTSAGEMEAVAKSQSMSESEGDTLSQFQDEIEPTYWDIKKETHEILEEQLDSQHSRTVRISVVDTAEQEEPRKKPEPPTDNGEERKSSRQCCSLWRLLLVAVHVLLLAIGAIVLSRHLILHSNKAMRHSVPTNDECSLLTEDHLLVETGGVVLGTTHGATKDIVPCAQEELSGVWYRTIGTGEPMIVTATSDNGSAPSVMVLSGPCGDLQCEDESSDEAQIRASSVLWVSEVEKLYHLLVYDYSGSDFSLMLEDGPSVNSNCASSTVLLLSEDNDNVTISSRTSLEESECASAQTTETTSSWFVIPGNGRHISASICSIESSAWTNNDDVYLSLLPEDCENVECGLRQSIISTNSVPSNAVDWVSLPGESYSLVAWSLDGVPISFSLCLTQSDAGKGCDAAIPLASYPNDEGRVEISGSISNETGTVASSTAASCSGRDVPSNAVWYTFEGTGGDVTATTCGGMTSNFSTVFDVFAGPVCDTMTCVTAGRTGNCGASGQQFLSWTTDPGQRYWIAVYGDIVSGVSGNNFTLDLSGITESNQVPTPVATIPASQQTERKPTSQIVGISILTIGSVCGLFALIAWRWRRLKHSDGTLPAQNQTK